MRSRNPLADVLCAIPPFAKGIAIGGIGAGLAVCGPLGKSVVAFADPPHDPWSAFLLWMILALPVLLIGASIWQCAVILVAWILSPLPLSLRLAPSAITLLGIVAAVCFAIALAFEYELGVLATPIAVSFVVISPSLMVRGDT